MNAKIRSLENVKMCRPQGFYLEPSMGIRPGRPTDPSWETRPKVPMSEESKEMLEQLAALFSTPLRKVSPMQVAARLLSDEVANYREVFQFLQANQLGDTWHSQVGRHDVLDPEGRKGLIVLEFSRNQAGEAMLARISAKAKGNFSVQHASVLKEFAYAVISSTPSGRRKVIEAAKEFGVTLHKSEKAFAESKARVALSHVPVLREYYQPDGPAAKEVYRFRYPINIVSEPYLCCLGRYFGVSVCILHAVIVGSAGYTDATLDGCDSEVRAKFIAFARRLGIVVRRVQSSDFWEDLSLDCEEEIRRQLAAACFGDERRWQEFPERAETFIATMVSVFKAEYESFPGHLALWTWFKEACSSIEPDLLGVAQSSVTKDVSVRGAISDMLTMFVAQAKELREDLSAASGEFYEVLLSILERFLRTKNVLQPTS